MDVDRPETWGSTLIKNHDENKTYIIVKFSESFYNAIQEYSASNQIQYQQNNQLHLKQYDQTSNNHNSHFNNNHKTSHHNNHHNSHHNLQNGSNSITNSNKRAKLHHHQNNNDINDNSNNNANNNRNSSQLSSSSSYQLSKNGATNNSKSSSACEAPTIKFQGTRGAIRFPNGKSYDFSLEQSDNSVECIRQSKNKWESVGKMACCLHVKGKDDVYQRTRTKMEAAEQEKRKYCTKLLGSPEHNTTFKCSVNTSLKPTKLLADPSSATKSSLISSSSSTNYGRIPHYYPDITNVDQMKKYKADFYKDIKEYQQLHGYLQKIEERFKKLRELLLQSVEGSPEWESAKEQIFREYDRVKGDSNFHKARNKYRQVYKKLAHIKEKIFQFKRQQTDKLKNNNKKDNNESIKRISKSANSSISNK